MIIKYSHVQASMDQSFTNLPGKDYLEAYSEILLLSPYAILIFLFSGTPLLSLQLFLLPKAHHSSALGYTVTNSSLAIKYSV